MPPVFLTPSELAPSMQRAGEEGRKVAEVAFINQLNDQLTEEDKKLSLQQKQGEWEARMRSVQWRGMRDVVTILKPKVQSPAASQRRLPSLPPMVNVPSRQPPTGNW